MNSIYKAYCRAFQAAFKLAIPILPYRNPKILRHASQLPAELTGRHIDRVLIVTDKTLHDLGLLEPLKKSLAQSGVQCVVYDKTDANPTVQNVEEARAVYLANSCGALIGFGGGSPIDCAKAVGARIARPNKPVSKMRGILKVMHPIPLLAAVPTTAGTGSEVTLAAVITDRKSGHKFPINDFFLIPKIAVLDVENTRTMPRSMTATTGMDALTHAVEAYIGGSTTKATKADALQAVRLIFCNLERAYADGNDMAARENMSTAAFLAGRAFSKSYVGYIHAVAHSLGGQYNIPHGLANAVLMPIVLEEYGESAHKKLHELAVAAGISAADEPDSAGAEKMIRAIREMNRRMDIPDRLPGIQKADIPLLAKRAATEANPLYPVPVLMDAKQLEQFYYKVADWGEQAHE